MSFSNTKVSECVVHLHYSTTHLKENSSGAQEPQVATALDNAV
jgi:hypothetical protein